ncbi:hypothetical protein [Paenibacillus montanisoli]|uniref:Uncharacterized protein n=1 Tax=Paenibacillus montanisoli TaxID=2081970 RepID=A0A328U9I1_9BACL|nr:hypothetical protein [Paenibacillus montanisoli]RAP77575.1 hypothetical protein DL346_03605 [Paenibacillus montanisoli]
MKRMGWKLTAAAIALAVAIPVSAYAADGYGSKKPRQTDIAAAKAGKLELAKKEKAAGKEAGFDPYRLAEQLGLDKTAIEQAMKAGKSLDDIARERGIEVQPLIDRLAADLLAAINVKLSSEQLTDEEKANIQKKVSLEAQRIYTTPLAEQMSKGNQLELNMKAVLDLLGLEKPEFGELMDAGKSISAIAAERGITREQLLDVISADLDRQAQSLIESKQLTQADVDKMKQVALKKIESFIDGASTAEKKR